MTASQAARLIVDLDAIADNYRDLARLAAPAATAAALKADAYGVGLAPVARTLAAVGCRVFFVAILEEGLALRRLLPEAEIFILHGIAGLDREGIARFKEARLKPILNSLAEIAAWREGGGKAAGLHIDTGMARLGLDLRDSEHLLSHPDLLRGIDLDLVMSHLACADEGPHPMNAAQMEKFRAFLDRFAWPAGKTPRWSLAASGGIFLGPDYHLDLVRPGIALYGGAPLTDRPNPLRLAVRLQANILQTREIDFDTPVGYGATYRSRRATRLATIGAGYADGLLRSLGNSGACFFEDQRLPIVGRVSMDLISIDIGSLGPERGRAGDWVDLIGSGQSLDDLAAAARTNAYEILTRLGSRLRRSYVSARGLA